MVRREAHATSAVSLSTTTTRPSTYPFVRVRTTRGADVSSAQRAIDRADETSAPLEPPLLPQLLLQPPQLRAQCRHLLLEALHASGQRLARLRRVFGGGRLLDHHPANGVGPTLLFLA